MWSESVVDFASPAVGVEVEVFEGVSSDVSEHFVVVGAVESFDLALGLWMVGPSVDGANAESDEPGVEPGDSDVILSAVGEGVVAEECVGQATLAEGVPEGIPSGCGGDVESGLDAEEAARVVIEDCEWAESLPGDFDGALEIKLPKLIGRVAFEA